jgi:L-lactate utilization protein LutB
MRASSEITSNGPATLNYVGCTIYMQYAIRIYRKWMYTSDYSRMISYEKLYEKYDATLHKNSTLCGVAQRQALSEMPAIKQFLTSKHSTSKTDKTKTTMHSNGFARMDKCRMGLDALDKNGWKRSYHQRQFHENFIAACARAFFKLDGPGSFQRAYQHVLEINGWNNLNQEILISTPRRFGTVFHSRL